ncbi:MAG TPA: peptidylprolyl isomerase [Gammaproteobacteria bacterium]|nr:peptidylprolyl isomerase [Gammaproteobacteria bacterium]
MKFHVTLLILLQLVFAMPAFAQDDDDIISTPTPAAPETTTEPATDTGSVTPEATGSVHKRYPLNRIVAIVNDDIILSSQLEEAMTAIVRQLQEKDTPVPEQSVLVKQVLERLVMETLQLEIAATNGITVDDATLNEEAQKLAAQSGLSLSAFREVLESQGYSYADFRDKLHKELLIQQVRRQMVSSRITVNDQEIDNMLATLKASGQGDVEYHLAHILVAIPEGADEKTASAAEQRAENILTRLRNGASFTEIAIAESDAQTALDGGDIGWRSLGQMPTLFLDPVKAMQVGDVSDLIRSPGGYHLIKLLEKRGDERHIVAQTRARHILLKPDEVNSDEEVQVRIEHLMVRLQNGEDFETLARAHSQDPLSAARGGDLGWLSQGDTVPAFEDQMNRLEPGEISKPFKTQFGWHVMQVMERREHDSTEEYERSKVRQLIRSRKYDEELFLWLRRLRDESYVDYRIDDV